MKIVCMLPVFNTSDFIGEVIENILSHQLDLVILDNGSTDGTYEICKKYSNQNNVKLLQIKDDSMEWFRILKILYDMALLESPDWVIRIDNDEIFESGIKGVSLRDAIIKVDSEGYNTIHFDWFEFFLTDDDNESKVKVAERMKYYSWQNDFLYRAWKVVPGVAPEFGWGQIPVFPKYQKYKIYPRKFVARHYRYRSIEQAKEKIKYFISRTKGTTEGNLGLYHRYELMENMEDSVVIDHSLLTRYHDDNKWNLERKCHPYTQDYPKKKEELFDEDGSLKLKIPYVAELRLLLRNARERTSKLNSLLERYQKEKI